MSTDTSARAAVGQADSVDSVDEAAAEAAAVAAGTGGSAPPAPVDAPPGAAPAIATTGWIVPMAVLVTGMFMSVLDTSIVNVAISTIQTELGGSTADVAWISTAYSLVLGVVVPASAWLGDRFGLARVYTLSLAAFALASALCGLAWNLDSLIAFRVIQAIPGGLLPAVTLTMVYRIVPREKIGAAMGMYGLGIIFAPAIGPALGGYLVEYFSWRLVFYINVPIGVVGVLAAIAFLPHFAKGHPRPFDVLGFLACASGLVALLLAFSEGSTWGWRSAPVVSLIAGGVLSLALFVVIELEVEHPLLDLRVFRTRAYVTSLLVMSIMMTGLFATLFYIPLFLQAGLGYAALDAGLLILPQALVMAVLTPISGRLYDKIGPRWLAFTGLCLAAFGSYLLAGITPDVTRGEIIGWTCVRAAGMGLAMMSIMTGGLAALPHHLTNSGSAINTLMQRVSAALGLAALTALAALQQAQLSANRGALLQSTDPAAARLTVTQLYAVSRQTQLAVLAGSYSNVFLLTALLTAIGAVGALFLRSGPAQHSGPKVAAE